MTTARKLATITLTDGTTLGVAKVRTPGQSFGRYFVIMFQDSLIDLMQRVRSGPTVRVLFVLPSFLDYVTWRRLNQRELGELLGVSQGGVSLALRELVAAGAIERRGSGSHVEWRMSSQHGWRGTAEQWHAEQRDRAASRASKATRPPPRTMTAECIDSEVRTEGRPLREQQRNLALLRSVPAEPTP